MRIGLDFDNTIVNYDHLFHTIAVEQSLIPIELPRSKIAVRNYLKSIKKENVWTALQGFVYGTQMHRSIAFPGVINFITSALNNDITILIISHKTKYPIIGPKYNLHQAARDWIKSRQTDVSSPLISPNNIFFETSKENKVSRITATRCNYFIDDLPEILLMSSFPKSCKRILFDPESCHKPNSSLDARYTSWQRISIFFNQL